jgi:hypothetical protein
MRIVQSRGFVAVVRVGLGASLVWSAVGKLDDPIAFLQAVYRYEIVGPGLGWWVAAVLPYAELVVGLSLLSGMLAGAAGWLAAGLGLAFVGAQGVAMARGLSIECGCFGSGGETIGWASVVRALMVACAGVVASTGAVASAVSPGARVPS